MSEILVEVGRGGRTESIHRGSIAVVDSTGRTVCQIGSTEREMSMRSCAKPIQAVPVIECGAAEHFGFTPEELAVFCGSLSGQDYHVAAVRSVLDKIGLSEADMACGVHYPSHRPTATELRRSGTAPGPLHNNCAGKHAAMLALCVYNGWAVPGYSELNHPVQQLILEKIARMSNVARGNIHAATDGCGVPVFYIPLKQLALAYAGLARPIYMSDQALDNTGRAVKVLMQAVLSHPEMVAGDQRICTDVMRLTSRDILAKTGAEGGYALTLFKNQLGVAIKIDDGSPRAFGPVVVEVLDQLGQLTAQEKEHLKQYHFPVVKNHRNEKVGELRPVFTLL